MLIRDSLGRFKKGIHPKTEFKKGDPRLTESGWGFKKGNIPWNKNRQKITCLNCEKEFEVSPYRKNTARFCSINCHNEFQRGKKPNREYKKTGEYKKCLVCENDFYVSPSLLSKRKYCSWDCYLKNIKEVVKKTLETRRKRGTLRTSTTFKKGHKKTKELWKNPEFIKKVIKGMRKKPNKDEKYLDGVIQRTLPNEFGYNGNFDLGITIGGLIPDYVNVNGKKQVIELFGKAFHREDGYFFDGKFHKTEWGRKLHYKQFGFDCLVIWDYELKDEKGVIQKINDFVGRNCTS